MDDPVAVALEAAAHGAIGLGNQTPPAQRRISGKGGQSVTATVQSRVCLGVFTSGGHAGIPVRSPGGV